MNAEILLKMKEEYENACVTFPMCIYASYLNSEDLCIWYNTIYLGISDRSDYEKKLAEDEMCTRLVYETTDEKKIKKIKKILGRVDYSRRLDELYSTITSEKQLSLTKK